MPREAPGWWYRTARSPAALALAPLAALYGWGARRRLPVRGGGYRSTLPVICIGNLVVGGAGKTPMALYVAARLRASGARPAFLTRGYGGTLAGPHLVDAKTDTAAKVGDEALLLAACAPTVVARDRAAGARLIETLPADVIVMDDGLQNPGLEKDLALAVIDGARGLGNGLVMPAGPLRAPLDAQLPLIDAVILNGESRGDLAAQLARRGFSRPVLHSRRVPAGDLGDLAGARWVAFAGIARPDSFFETARGMGALVVACRAFGDHHAYTEGDARDLLALAEATGAFLLTTQKDMVRLSANTGPLAELRARCVALGIDVVMEPSDSARLATLLDLVLRGRGPASAGRPDQLSLGAPPCAADGA